MAKLGRYYGLCPLIDHRSLLGICEDENRGNVVVTLGKNIAIKYKLSDQKQVHSWRTRDKFTSPVIYDKSKKCYYAVFNQTYIRTWIGDVDNICTLKKHKFTIFIHTIFTYRNKFFIVFQNGSVLLLIQALETRKNLTCEDVIDTDTEFIADVLCGCFGDEIYIGLMINANDTYNFVWYTFNDGDKNSDGFNKISINREGATLTGYVCHSDNKHGDVKLITLWSDGRVYLYSLTHHEPDLHYSKLPGDLHSVIESVCCKESVTIASLSDDYLAMYGAAPNEEGAILLIYNLSFRVVQSKLSFKMFSMGTKMWVIEDYLLLCVGQNLAVVPFTVETEKLAALVSSHKVSKNEGDSDDVQIIQKLELASWNNKPIKSEASSIPARIKDSVLQFSEQGWPENLICDTLIPEYLENNNVESVLSCLKYFSDMSEKCLAKILKFCLNAKADCFAGKKSCVSSTLQPSGRCVLMNHILKKQFCDVQLLPHLHAQLDIKNVIDALNYILFLLSEENRLVPLSAFETEEKLLRWVCVLLDANFQKLLITKDEETVEVLTRFKKLVDENLSNLQNLQQLAPLVQEVIKGKLSYKSTARANDRYCVEELKLY